MQFWESVSGGKFVGPVHQQMCPITGERDPHALLAGGSTEQVPPAAPIMRRIILVP